MKTENYLKEFYFILFAQRKVILWTTILFFILSVLIAFLWPPVYSASGSILAKAKKVEKDPEAIENVELRPFPITKEDLASESEILTSPDVIERTIRLLQEKNLYKKTDKLSDEVYKIQNQLKTVIIPASNVIEVTFYNGNPDNAVSILGTLMDQYVFYRMNVYSPSEAEGFYSQQADQFKNELQSNENNIMGIVGNSRIADPQKEIDKNILLKKDLEQQLLTLKSEAIEKEGNISHLDRALKEKNIQYFSYIDNKPLNDLSAKLQELTLERGKVLRVYNEKSDKIKLIDKQIEDTFSLIKSEISAIRANLQKQLHIVQNKITAVKSDISALNDSNVQLQKQLIDSQRIAREIKLQEFSYETFSKRREEARINNTAATTSLANVSILSKAFPSDGPVFPKKPVVIPLGMLVGFITGCSFGFLREFFDHTFKKPSDVYNYVGLPVIFSIPERSSKQT